MTEGGTQENGRGPGRTRSLWLPGWQCTGYSDSPRRRPPDPPKPRSHHFRLPQLLRPRSSNPHHGPLSPANRISSLYPPWPIATRSPALPHHAAAALTLHAAHWSRGQTPSQPVTYPALGDQTVPGGRRLGAREQTRPIGNHSASLWQPMGEE